MQREGEELINQDDPENSSERVNALVRRSARIRDNTSAQFTFLDTFDAQNTKNAAPITTSKARQTEQERRLTYNKEFGSWVSDEELVRVLRSTIDKQENIIGSHTFFLRKDDGTLKSRIVPWGNLDREREYLRTDSRCANLEIFRVVL